MNWCVDTTITTKFSASSTVLTGIAVMTRLSLPNSEPALLYWQELLWWHDYHYQIQCQLYCTEQELVWWYDYHYQIQCQLYSTDRNCYDDTTISTKFSASSTVLIGIGVMTRLSLPNSVPALLYWQELLWWHNYLYQIQCQLYYTDRNCCDDTTITTKFSDSTTVLTGIAVMTDYHYQIQCQLYCTDRNCCDDTTITTKFSASSTVLTGIAVMTQLSLPNSEPTLLYWQELVWWHDYHYQIQCQLYCTDRNWCDDTTITTKCSASSTVLTGIAVMTRLSLPNSVPPLQYWQELVWWHDYHYQIQSQLYSTDRNCCDDTTITTKFSASSTVLTGIAVMTRLSLPNSVPALLYWQELVWWHDYHYQIQCQLYCTDRNWCDDTTITTKFSASSTVLTGNWCNDTTSLPNSVPALLYWQELLWWHDYHYQIQCQLYYTDRNCCDDMTIITKFSASSTVLTGIGMMTWLSLPNSVPALLYWQELVWWHNYHYQIQCQLYCTDRNWCDVSRTNKYIYIGRIYRDKRWWGLQLEKWGNFS